MRRSHKIYHEGVCSLALALTLALAPLPLSTPGGYLLHGSLHAEPNPDISESGRPSARDAGSAFTERFPFYTIYEDAILAGADRGGDPGELRPLDRILNTRRLGGEGGYSSSSGSDSTYVGARLTVRQTIDYTYFNPESHTYRTSYGPGESLLFYRSGSGDREELRRNARRMEGDLLGTGVLSPRLFSLQAGYGDVVSDPEGFLFVGEAPAARLFWSMGGRGWRALVPRISLFAMEANREVDDWRRMPRRDGWARFYGGSMGFGTPLLHLHLWGGIYHSTGRTALPDMVVFPYPGIPYYFATGRTALPESYVHYYGVRAELLLSRFALRLAVLENHGQMAPVMADGSQESANGTSIRGSMAYLSSTVGMGQRRFAAGCAGQSSLLLRRNCIEPYDQTRSHELELSLLGSSRDRNIQDRKRAAFGAIRPSVAVFGGEASILLSGPPLLKEEPPFQNRQPGRDLFVPASSGSGSSGNREPDNRDPSPPDYQNGGIRAASLAYRALFYGFQGGIRASYFRFLQGEGREGIVHISRSFPLFSQRSEGGFFLAATGADYRPDADQVDPITGLHSRAHLHSYIRYMAGFYMHF